MLRPAIILNIRLPHGAWTDARRRHVDLAGVGLGIGDEFGGRPRRHRGVDFQDHGHAQEARNRRDVVDKIVAELLEQRRVDRIDRIDEEQRVAVCWRAHYGLGPNIVAAARPVLDDELLAEPLRQPAGDQARRDIGRRAGGRGDDHAHGARGIGLRPADPRHHWKHSSAGSQMQECAAGRFMEFLPRNAETFLIRALLRLRLNGFQIDVRKCCRRWHHRCAK